MFRFDILPRLIPDFHGETREEALAEVARRRASPVAPDAVTRFDESPYGGYRVYTVSLEIAMEVFVDMADSGVFPGESGAPDLGYRKTAAYR